MTKGSGFKYFDTKAYPAALHRQVTEPKNLKLLLVEDDLEDEQLLAEAFLEIEENRQWCNWQTTSVVHVQELADALDCLERDRFDVVLLNLSLPDSPALLDSFLKVKACSQSAPIVVLADEPDENLAHRLLREGAQDVFLKPELEYGPLARSLRYAIERQRRHESLRSSPFVDDLTGTLTRQAFLAIAAHYTHFAQFARTDLSLAVAEIAGLRAATPEERDARELFLIRAGEVLRCTFEAPALLGHVAHCRFALIIPGLTPATLEAMLNRAAAEIEDACGSAQNAAAVRVWSSELRPEDNLEGLLSADGESAAQARPGVKTVMLAD